MDAASAQDSTRTYQIAEQSLGQALREFALASNLDLLFSPDLVAGKKSASLDGKFTIDEGLRTLLRGSGLEFSVSGSRVIISEAKPVTSRQATSSTPQGTNGYTRLAQAETGSPQSSVSSHVSAENSQASDKERIELEEIVVTGTHIRGSNGSAGTKVHVLDRADIDRTGQATVEDILKSSPLIFQGGPSQDARGGTGSSNTFFGSGIDLRGLGTASTLTLVNGHRLPLAAGANFVDVSNIPASAIERIEMLPDGASAIYGSDAVAGVVNIILRDDYEGAETQLRAGAATAGGVEEYQASQTFGHAWSSGHGLLALEYYQRSALANADRDYTANADLRAFGGDDFRDTFSNPGTVYGFDSSFQLVPLLGIPPGQDGTDLTPGELLPTVNKRNQNATRDVLPRQQRWNLFGTVKQNVGGDVELFAEGKYSRREYETRAGGFSNVLLVGPPNPFFVNSLGIGTDVIGYDFENDVGISAFTGDVATYGGVAGINAPLGGDWRLNAYGSFGRDLSTFVNTNTVDSVALQAALNDPNPATAFNPYGDHVRNNPATIATFRRDLGFDLDSRLSTINAIADGTVYQLPGGAVKLAVGADYRDEDYQSTTRVPPTSTVNAIHRAVSALFAELYVPLVGEANRRRGVERLAVSLAGRYDSYTGVTDDSTTNPKVGVSWAPFKGFSLRGTYGTSFRAPSLLNLDESRNGLNQFNFPDPMSPTGTTQALYRTGNNALLKNETADVWTIGFDVDSPALPAWRFGATFFDIVYRDRISRPPQIATILIEEDKFSSIFVRNPSQAQIAAYCDLPEFARSGGNPTTCKAIAWGALIDARLNNTAITKLQGLDINLSYALESEQLGHLSFGLDSTYYLQFEEQFSVAAPNVETMNKVGNPVDFHLRASAAWTNSRGLSVWTFANYVPSYRDNLSVPNRRIESLTTVDINVAYALDAKSEPLSGVTLFVNVANAFDQRPPFVNNPIGLAYDPQNYDPVGRFISLNVVKRW